jgi:hypothetical protein
VRGAVVSRSRLAGARSARCHSALTGVLFFLAHPGQHPAWAFAFAALGVRPMGLFHAGPGAFPRTHPPAAASEGAAEDPGQPLG